MNEKLKALIVLLIIIIGILPVYMTGQYLKSKLRPRESMTGLLFYLLSMLAIIFISTFLIVFVIGKLFHRAS